MTKSLAISEAQAIILERLIEAMETDDAMLVRVGPQAFGSSMPEYVHTASENYARDREDITETGGMRTREEHKSQSRQTERRRRRSRERITRMEEAFDWVRRFIFDDEARQVLLAYAVVKARGWDWTRYVTARNRKNPKKTAWVKRTIYRWIIKSLQIIETKLRQSETFWLPQADLHVAHRAA